MKISESKRLKLIDKHVQRLFGQIVLYESFDDSYDDKIVEMFTLTRIENGVAELTHLFNNEIIRPVIFPEGVRELIRLEDTFLLEIGLKASTWHILYMSPAYTFGEIGL